MFRMLTFNIAHGRGLGLYQGFHSGRGIERVLTSIADMLKEEHCDIVALQEVDVKSHWNREINLLEHIREAADFPHAEAGLHNMREGDKPLAYGNAVLSRYPFRACETVPFGTETLGEKGFMTADIDTPDGPLTLINLHLDYKSRKRRIEQIEILVARLEERGGTAASPIICGDFNSTSKAERDAVNHLLTFVRRFDSYTLLPQDSSTFPAFLPVRSLDFILVPERFRVVSHRVVKSYLSDHRPVLAELVLR